MASSPPSKTSVHHEQPKISLSPIQAQLRQNKVQPPEDTSKPPSEEAPGVLSNRSTHGHNLLEVESMAKHAGTSVTTFFAGLFQTILAISTLGASITFNYVLSGPGSNTPKPSTRRFSANEVQLFLAISWLLFLLALAFAAAGQTLLTFFRRHWEEDWDGKRGKTSQTTVQMYAVSASAILAGLVVGAFMLLCLVVVAYSSIVGWIALGFTSFFGFIMLISIINQVPWPWRDNSPHVRAPKQLAV